MRVAGLRSRLRRRLRPVSLTDSNHDWTVALNRLRDRAVPPQRDASWVADITYVETDEGWLYVAGVLNRCTRRCVGWALDDTPAATLPLAALDMALQQLRSTAGRGHHSDCGLPYASAADRQRLARAGVIPSMSRAGNCCDNAARESFWSSLKRELVHRCQFATRAEARTASFEWIEVVYNREQFHSALGCKFPVDFGTQLKISRPHAFTPCSPNRGKARSALLRNEWRIGMNQAFRLALEAWKREKLKICPERIQIANAYAASFTSEMNTLPSLIEPVLAA